jgi:hypothetical protein
MLRYLRGLTPPKLLLWSYLIWYAHVAVRYFDPHLSLWLSSLGLSVIIGSGLYVSTAFHGTKRVSLGFWPTFRFYLMPFCVSSFAALIKGRGFVLIFHPQLFDNALALSHCLGFAASVLLLQRVVPIFERHSVHKRAQRRQQVTETSAR